jgi:hypothetical protein
LNRLSDVGLKTFLTGPRKDWKPLSSDVEVVGKKILRRKEREISVVR